MENKSTFAPLTGKNLLSGTKNKYPERILFYEHP
jgi:hypothetical protein